MGVNYYYFFKLCARGRGGVAGGCIVEDLKIFIVQFVSGLTQTEVRWPGDPSVPPVLMARRQVTTLCLAVW